jgi:DNA repair exonuclease SbcCD ATPase subunit
MLFYKNEILKSQSELQECYTHDGKIAQARAAIQRLEVAKKSLEEALARNEKIIAFDAGMRLVEDILSRSGAPIEFIKLQFANLGTLTEKYLSILEAGFTIKANPQASLDFLFMRTDQTDSTWMPIGKLSGGQRVRLCLAFLLALQKLLVINIGLLFLDEPSNHLDDDGRSNLIQLFHSFQNNLLETQGQLWISDHDKNLATAFNVTIDLDHAS